MSDGMETFRCQECRHQWQAHPTWRLRCPECQGKQIRWETHALSRAYPAAVAATLVFVWMLERLLGRA